MTTVVESEQQEIVGLLIGLVQRLGAERVIRDLGVTPGELAEMMMGDLVFPIDTVDRIRRVQSVIRNGVHDLGLDEGPSQRLEATAPVDSSVIQEDLLPDEYQPRQPAGPQARDALDQLKADLYRVRMMALRQRVGLALREDEKLANHLFVLQIELTLILEFGESVPEPGMGWNPVTLDEEADKRFRRRDRLQAELAKYTTGVRGMFRRISGRRPLTLDELMQSLMRDAHLIHQAGEIEAESTEQALARLLGPSGFDADGVRELLRQNARV